MDEIRVGDWRVEPQLNRISGRGTVQRLEPRVIDLLTALAERPGEVVSKRELLDRVWGDAHVTEGVLKRAVWELRRALGDDARKPRLIETVPRRGYRLIDEPPPQPPAAVAGASAAPRRAVPGVLAAVVLVGLLAGFAVGRQPPAGPAPARPVTALAGREIHPALSADGSRLAFAWNGGRGDDFDLYVKLVDGEHLRRLTRHPGVDSRPAWSADGNHLAFVREAPDPEQSGVFLVSVLGGPPRRLLEARAGRVAGLAFSPRGGELAIALAPAGRSSALYLLSVDRRELRQLTHPPAAEEDRDPVFSPDGRDIAFVRAARREDQDVYRVEVGGGRETRLTSDGGAVLGLAWTDDGAAVVYSSDRRGPRTLWRVARNGGAPEWLPASGDGALHPAADRSGRRLVFEQVHCDSDIRRVTDAPAAAVESVIASTRRDQFPQLSPDGRSLAFVSTRGGTYEVYLAAADGGSPRRLTDLDGPRVTALRWSPDSTRIAIETWHRGDGDVSVVDVASGRARRLAGSPEPEEAPGWSADGERVYFGSPRTGRWEIWAVPAAGGSPRQVTTTGGRAAVESSDGRWLYYSRHRTPGIWRRPVAGGAEERVVEDFDRDNGVDWVLTDGGIYYLAHRQGAAGVAFFDFGSARSSLRFPLDQLPFYGGLTLAADRRSVLLTHVAAVDGDVMLLDRPG